MEPYKIKELEQRGWVDTLLSGKPQENGWAAINNLLAEAKDMTELTPQQFKSAAGKWDVKFSDVNNAKRSAIYRQLAEVIYGRIETPEDDLLQQLTLLSQCLALSPQLTNIANKAAKKIAFANRCRGILAGTEKRNIQEVNALYGYDYEDGLAERRLVFEEHFYKDFERFETCKRYSLDDEAALTAAAAQLDVPFEMKENITAALERFRNLWNAETQQLSPIKVEFPLQPGEECYAGTNSGRCEKKQVEVQENFFDLNRKFTVDDTLSFKGGKMDARKELQEQLMIDDIGYFFVTNQRLVFFSKKTAVTHALADVTGADYKDNCIYYHMKNGEDAVYKYSDDASECMYIIFKRVLAMRDKQ